MTCKKWRPPACRRGRFCCYVLRSLIGRGQANTIEKRALTRFDAIEFDVKNCLKAADIHAPRRSGQSPR